MDPLNYLKIYPIGEGWPEYWVEDSRTNTIVYGHPLRIWCIDWVLENHVRHCVEKAKFRKAG
ncbi:hypothetical protein CH370_19765 [Leptospira kmetyi]|uniref:Uncharacterized protein n=1 Tax=Leptospira kmetyi TaxID=408139 RepID=A0ABX4N6P4_9LEPT|nr:hypothetical protein CH378_14320 [Leptospira kmetyi]PJZ39694.1 hypothetical protein CH370_19765 [Leptospira kmetyi]